MTWTKSSFGITIATYALLGLAGIVSFSLPEALPSTSAAPASPIAVDDRAATTNVVNGETSSNPDIRTAPATDGR